jgi:hypothetical protein
VHTITTVEFQQPSRIRLDDGSGTELPLSAVPILGLAFPSGSAFMDSLIPNRGGAGELMVRTRARPRAGTAMIAEVRWPSLPNRVYLRVEAGAPQGDGRLLLRIDPDEIDKCDFLVGVASGTAQTHRRRHRRYCVRLQVEWRPFGTHGMIPGVAHDLSIGGMRIATDRAYVGIDQNVVIRVRALQDLVLTGAVQHIHHRMNSNDWVIGVRFQHRETGEQRTLRQLLRECAGRGVMVVEHEATV